MVLFRWDSRFSIYLHLHKNFTINSLGLFSHVPILYVIVCYFFSHRQVCLNATNKQIDLLRIHYKCITNKCRRRNYLTVSLAHPSPASFTLHFMYIFGGSSLFGTHPMDSYNTHDRFPMKQWKMFAEHKPCLPIYLFSYAVVFLTVDGFHTRSLFHRAVKGVENLLNVLEKLIITHRFVWDYTECCCSCCVAVVSLNTYYFTHGFDNKCDKTTKTTTAQPPSMSVNPSPNKTMSIINM